MNTYKVKASYIQWIEIEIQADNEEEAYELVDDTDLDKWNETDINDFHIHDMIFIDAQGE
jgi:hypothetical protein